MSLGEPTESMLEVRGISASYGSREVLYDVSLSVNAGEFVGLAGPNGSGKTTLLHTMTGYHGVTAGEVFLRGKSVSGLSRRAIAGDVAFVPQQTEPVYSFSVLEMVLMGRHPFAGLSAFDSAADVSLAYDALERLDIGALAERDFGQLSGGEKQLVLLARAFVQGTPILLLDEPLTGLDLRHQYHLMNAISAYRADAGSGRAVMATFHDLSTAARWCTTLILIRDGRIMASGRPGDVITAQNMARVYDVDAEIYTDAAGQLSIYVRGYLVSAGS